MSIIGLIVLMMASCKKDPEMPSGEYVNIKTNEVTDVTAVSAVVSAYVGAGCDGRGVCWSTSPNPTISGSHTINGSGIGSFTSNITGLTDNTKYYVRAYATNSAGTSYGEQKSFTTQSFSVPTVKTSSVSNIAGTTATCGGNVTSDGGATVTAHGVCWSTSQNPTVAGSHTTDGSGTGSFTSSIIGLTENTTYYVRAYATNSKGTSYGEQKNFTTQSGGGDQIQSFTVNGVSFKMIPVEGGTFTMGATSEQGSDAYDDETPTHSVTLSDYYIGEFEVTQKLWEAVMGSNPSYFNGDNLPVEDVSWNDCQEFINELNRLCVGQLKGKTFSLPTEAQREYAARGGNRSRGYKYSGSNSISEVAWYYDNSGSKTHTVGTKSPNELGIYDMSGNVWEWCQDWYGSYGSGSQTNPMGPSFGADRVNRGGCWYSRAGRCRISDRGYGAPSYRSIYLGFRVVLIP